MTAGRGTTRSGAAGGPARHIPVLLSEALEAIAPKDGGVYLDGTFGAGGYSQALLEAADCIVIAVDRDPSAIAAGASLARRFDGRLRFAQGSFAEMETIAARHDIESVDGIALDLGVSSMQLDTPERGFSFQTDGPLDMRMSGEGESAADAVNSLSEDDLAQIIAVFGEERRARAIARAIVGARASEPFERTSQLADLVSGVLGRRPGSAKHPATRTFQALRLYVNNELLELANGLLASERLLRAEGRLVVVTFHSLEDRIAKRFLNYCAKPAPGPSRHRPPIDKPASLPSFRLINRRPLRPAPQETARNPRARSARLRAAERTASPPLSPATQDIGLPLVAGSAT